MKLPLAETEEGLNLTPLIDVVFLLLIFFLVATRINEEERELTINVPDVLQAQPLSMGSQEIVVNVTKEGKYRILGHDYAEAQVVALLHEAFVKNPGGQKVQIRADENVPFKFPIAVAGICKQEGLEYTCSVLQRR